jgi:hypothetical protein
MITSTYVDEKRTHDISGQSHMMSERHNGHLDEWLEWNHWGGHIKTYHTYIKRETNFV